jgi:prepilin-type N-terminal cleavage/methylation domain-containing protein
MHEEVSTNHHNKYQRGFSLVELSIVLVILGLLTGGILAGQSLIRAAELRSITTQFNQYVSATQSFRDKYMALPGDMPNATRF